MREIGQLLKEKREEKKVSLEEVAVATKISLKVLQALEEGDLTRLPAKPFIRGFIQSYARYLGLDVKEILNQFQESLGSTNPKTPFTLPQTDNLEKNLPGSGRQIITVAGIIIIIIAIVVIQRFLSKREAEMHPGEVQAITGNDSPLKILPTAAPSPSTAASPETSAAPNASSSPSTSAITSTSTSATTSTTISAPTSVPTSAPTAISKLSSTSSILPSPQVKPTVTPIPSPTSTPVPKATPTPAPQKPSPTPEVEAIPQEIIVEALDKVTLKVTIDSKSTQEVTLNADQIQTFKAKGNLKIYTPNGGAISIIHNGFDLGVPGNLGQPKTMVFPK